MFGDRLKELRLENNYKQKDIACIVGISRQTYGKYEREINQPDFDTLVKLANHYNVSIDYILGRTNVKNLNGYVIEQDFHKTHNHDTPQVIELISLTDDVIKKYKEHPNFKVYLDIIKKLKDIFR